MKYPIPEDLSIPSWLLIDPTKPRPKLGVVRLTDPHHSTATSEEVWKQRQEVVDQQRAAAKKARNAEHLASVKAKHPGEKYDRKLKRWITIPVTKEQP